MHTICDSAGGRILYFVTCPLRGIPISVLKQRPGHFTTKSFFHSLQLGGAHKHHNFCHKLVFLKHGFHEIYVKSGKERILAQVYQDQTHGSLLRAQ